MVWTYQFDHEDSHPVIKSDSLTLGIICLENMHFSMIMMIWELYAPNMLPFLHLLLEQIQFVDKESLLH